LILAPYEENMVKLWSVFDGETRHVFSLEGYNANDQQIKVSICMLVLALVVVLVLVYSVLRLPAMHTAQ